MLKKCCKCNKEFQDKNYELDKIITIKHTFGYGGKYWDKTIELDICEDCLIEVAGKEPELIESPHYEQLRKAYEQECYMGFN